jgi:prepilin-type N-terminal cleavage/methylation domain-containing protein
MLLPGNRRGFTLVEMITVMSIFGGIASLSLAMMVSTLKSVDGSSTMTFTGADAVTAVNTMAQDLREAKSYSLLDSDKRLSIIFPETTTASGASCYDRREADDDSEVQYYVADNSGNLGTSGKVLWRTAGGARRAIIRDVDSLSFVDDVSNSVEVNITTSGTACDGARQGRNGLRIFQTQLSQRVFLRNY